MGTRGRAALRRVGAGEAGDRRRLMDGAWGQLWAATSHCDTNQMVCLSVPSPPVSLSPSLLASLAGRGQPEAEGGHPEEHGDRPGSGDA